MDDAPPQLIEAVVEPMDGRACMRCSLLQGVELYALNEIVLALCQLCC